MSEDWDATELWRRSENVEDRLFKASSCYRTAVKSFSSNPTSTHSDA